MERRIERLDKYLKFKHLSTNKVSVMAQLSTGVISKSREDNRDLSDDACKKLLGVLNDLNPDWLFNGEGEMLTCTPFSNTINGDHNVGNGTGNTVNSENTVQELFNQLKAKDAIISKSQAQLDKSQEQIDRLIALLEKREER